MIHIHIMLKVKLTHKPLSIYSQHIPLPNLFLLVGVSVMSLYTIGILCSLFCLYDLCRLSLSRQSDTRQRRPILTVVYHLMTRVNMRFFNIGYICTRCKMMHHHFDFKRSMKKSRSPMGLELEIKQEIKYGTLS